MSRRRWSNEYVESLKSFQSKSNLIEDSSDLLGITINTKDESDLLRSTVISDSNVLESTFTEKDEFKSNYQKINSTGDLIRFSIIESDTKNLESLEDKNFQDNLNSRLQEQDESQYSQLVSTNTFVNDLINFTFDSVDTQTTIPNDKFNECKDLDFPNKPSAPAKKSKINMLKRLSMHFKNTPDFTEKLLNIIEESVSSSPNNDEKHSAIGIQDMTSEFRKLCKYIGDETVPDWGEILNNTCEIIENIEEPTFLKDSSKYDLSSPKKISTDISLKITQSSNSPNKSFEYWEAVCNMICDQETKQRNNQPHGEIDSFESDKKTMLSICEKQLASLEDSFIDTRSSAPLDPINNELKIIGTPRSKSDFWYENQQTKLTDDWKCQFSSDREAVLQCQNQKITENCRNESSELNDDSIIKEIQERRQRCIDTAKLMLEIDDGKGITNDDKKCLETLYKFGIQDKTIPEVESDVQFLNTLNECLQYKKFLINKHKSSRVLQTRNIKEDEKKIVNNKLSLEKKKKKVENKTVHRNDKIEILKTLPKNSDKSKSGKIFLNFGNRNLNKTTKEPTIPILKSKLTRNDNYISNYPQENPADKVHNKGKVFEKKQFDHDTQKNSTDLKNGARNKLFVSPGTSPGVRNKPSNYFSSSKLNNLRTPQKLQKEEIKSPVGLYIHGIDTNLIKNIHTKTNDRLLTPTSKGEKSSTSPRLKFNLSAKENKSPIIANIILPKVTYKPPDKVLMEINKQKIPGIKMQNLLKNTQNTVIIRHEGRTDSDLNTDTSIRIQRIAEKAKRKNLFN